MNSQEFPVCSQHPSLSPRLLLPKRAKWGGAQSQEHPQSPRSQTAKAKPELPGRKVCKPEVRWLLAFQGTQLGKKPLLEGRYNPGTEALDPGSKMALGIAGPLDWDLELLGDISSHWGRYELPWVCSRGHAVRGGWRADRERMSIHAY